MFTVKVEDNDGVVTLYEAEENVRHKWVSVESYEDLQEAREIFLDLTDTGRLATASEAGHWPWSEEEFDALKRDVKVQYCGVEPDKNTLIRVGKVELIGDMQYDILAIFAAKVYIMNEQGQTVETLDLLR